MLHQIDRVCCFQCFVSASPFGKLVSHEPPTPRKVLPLNPPPPWNVQWSFVGVGVWIFSGTTHEFSFYPNPSKLLSWQGKGDRDGSQRGGDRQSSNSPLSTESCYWVMLFLPLLILFLFHKLKSKIKSMKLFYGITSLNMLFQWAI